MRAYDNNNNNINFEINNHDKRENMEVGVKPNHKLS